MWNSISKLIDPNFKPAPRGARGDSRGGKRGKAPYNKKRKFRDEKKSSFGNKSKPSSYGRSSSSSRDGEKKSFGFKGKKVSLKKTILVNRRSEIDHQEMERKKALVLKEKKFL